MLVLRTLPERAMDPQREKPITFVLVLNESRPTVHHEPLVEAPKLLDHTNRDNDRLLRLLVTVVELVAGWDRPAAVQIPPQWPLDDIKTLSAGIGPCASNISTPFPEMKIMGKSVPIDSPIDQHLL